MMEASYQMRFRLGQAPTSNSNYPVKGPSLMIQSVASNAEVVRTRTRRKLFRAKVVLGTTRRNFQKFKSKYIFGVEQKFKRSLLRFGRIWKMSWYILTPKVPSLSFVLAIVKYLILWKHFVMNNNQSFPCMCAVEHSKPYKDVNSHSFSRFFTAQSVVFGSG